MTPTLYHVRWALTRPTSAKVPGYCWPGRAQTGGHSHVWPEQRCNLNCDLNPTPRKIAQAALATHRTGNSLQGGLPHQQQRHGGLS